MLKRAAIAALVTIGGATVAFAQNVEVIKQRREVMRAVGNASGSVWKMYKGEAPFELTKVQGALRTMEEQFRGFKDLFPDNSKEGGGTDAKPLIWAKKSDFNGSVDATIEDIKTAAAGIKDEASFKIGYKAVAEACGGCHKADGGYTIRLSESFKKPKP